MQAAVQGVGATGNAACAISLRVAALRCLPEMSADIR
jgi:hypothetical protein